MAPPGEKPFCVHLESDCTGALADWKLLPGFEGGTFSERTNADPRNKGVVWPESAGVGSHSYFGSKGERTNNEI